MPEPRPQYAGEVRSALTDIAAVMSALGLQDKAKKSGNGWEVRCPHHGGHSLSLTIGPDGTIRVKCFGCDFRGDVLHLIAESRGYSTRDKDQFREVMIEAAEIAGNWPLADEIRGYVQEREANRPKVEPPTPRPPPEYPQIDDVLALWDSCKPVTEDKSAAEYLQGRSISPIAATERQLLRVIVPGTTQPAWASTKGLQWFHSGHRIITRTYAPDGAARSVRAWLCQKQDYPKRLPPTGHRAQGLVLANDTAVQLLKGKTEPGRVVITEGEPDWATVSAKAESDDAVFGIGSGFWTEDHARKIPKGMPVMIMTDPDDAGNKYAENVIKTLNNRCPVWRLEL